MKTKKTLLFLLIICIITALPFNKLNCENIVYSEELYKAWQDVSITQFVDDGIASSVSFSVDNLIPYVAYIDYTGRAVVKKYTGGEWIILGGDYISDSSVYFTSIVVDNGIPFVACSDSLSLITVKKYDGTSWVTVGDVGFLNGQGTRLSLAVENGIPYIANDISNNIVIMKYNGDLWEQITDINLENEEINSISLSVSGGIPYLTYYGGEYGQNPKALQYVDGVWSNFGSDVFTIENTLFNVLSTDNETIYVVYTQSEIDEMFTLSRFSNGVWEKVGKVELPKIPMLITSLTVDNGVPYVWYLDADNNSYKVMKYDIASLKSDALLSSLTISNLPLEFSSQIFEYSGNVENNIDSIQVTPNADVLSHSTIKVNNNTVINGNTSSDIPLQFGANTITVEVTAQDGVTVNTYIITVNRLSIPIVINSVILNSNGDCIANIVSQQQISGIIVFTLLDSQNRVKEVYFYKDLTGNTTAPDFLHAFSKHVENGDTAKVFILKDAVSIAPLCTAVVSQPYRDSESNKN